MKYEGYSARAALFAFLTLLACATASTSQAQQQLQLVAHLSEEPSFVVAVQDSIVFSGGDTSVFILNISDPARPDSLSRAALPRTPDELSPRGEHLFVGTCFLLAVLDVSDPYNSFITDTADQEMCVGPLTFRGDTAFVPMRSGTVMSYMWDVSDPYDLERLESFTSVTNEVAFTDSIFYSISSHGPWSARIVSWSPFDIEDQTPFPDVHSTWAGELNSDYLYVVGDGGLYVYDIRQNPLSPTLIARMEQLGSLHDLAVANDRVYVVSTEKRGLVVLDVADPAHPTVIGAFEVTDARDVAVSDSLVFLSAGDDGLYILRDVTATGVERDPPRELTQLFLEPVAPNPVGENATIRFHVPSAGAVRLAVYDALGREVAIIVDAYRPRGRHEVTWTPMELASGMYVLHLEAGAYRESRSFSLVR